MNRSRTFQCTFSPDGLTIVTCEAIGRVASWPLATLDAGIAAEQTLRDVWNLCLETGRETLITADEHSLTRRSADTLAPIRPAVFSERVITALSSLPGGDLLTAEVDHLQQGWLVRRRAADLQVDTEQFVNPVQRKLTGLRPVPEQNLLLYLNWTDPTVQFATLTPLKVLEPLPLNGGTICLAVDSVQSRFAHAEARRVSVRDLTSRELCWSEPQSDSIHWMEFTTDGTILVVATADRVLRTWDAGTGRLLTTMTGHRGAVRHGALTSDGRTLFTADNEGELKVWHLATGDLLGSIDLRTTTGISELILSPAGDHLYVRLRDRTLQLIPLTAWQQP